MPEAPPSACSTKPPTTSISTSPHRGDINAGHRAGTCTALVGSQPLPDVTPGVHRATTSDTLYEVLMTELSEARGRI